MLTFFSNIEYWHWYNVDLLLKLAPHELSFKSVSMAASTFQLAPRRRRRAQSPPCFKPPLSSVSAREKEDELIFGGFSCYVMKGGVIF